MSLPNRETLECPSCQHEQEVTVWATVNVTLDPELREGLFSGKLNVFCCEQCGNTARIDAGLVYNDMEKEIFVMYQPSEGVEDPRFLSQFDTRGRMSLPKGFARLSSAGEYMLRPHVVFAMWELVQYVRFRELLLARAEPPGNSADKGQS